MRLHSIDTPKCPHGDTCNQGLRCRGTCAEDSTVPMDSDYDDSDFARFDSGQRQVHISWAIILAALINVAVLASLFFPESWR